MISSSEPILQMTVFCRVRTDFVNALKAGLEESYRERGLVTSLSSSTVGLTSWINKYLQTGGLWFQSSLIERYILSWNMKCKCLPLFPKLEIFSWFYLRSISCPVDSTCTMVR